MSTVDEQIPVSEAVKAELDRRRRDGESYNDVLERLVTDDRDLFAGFGVWSDEETEQFLQHRREQKDRREERTRADR